MKHDKFDFDDIESLFVQFGPGSFPALQRCRKCDGNWAEIHEPKANHGPAVFCQTCRKFNGWLPLQCR